MNLQEVMTNYPLDQQIRWVKTESLWRGFPIKKRRAFAQTQSRAKQVLKSPKSIQSANLLRIGPWIEGQELAAAVGIAAMKAAHAEQIPLVCVVMESRYGDPKIHFAHFDFEQDLTHAEILFLSTIIRTAAKSKDAEAQETAFPYRMAISAKPKPNGTQT